MLKGNKGEWSEIYTLLKIVADKKLYAGDGDLNTIENLLFPIVKILRDESHGTYEYSYDSEIVLIKGKNKEYKIPVHSFHEQAAFLLSKLKNASNATFSIPEVEEFLSSFNCSSIKAKSTVKTDIRVVIHDQRTGTNPELGFSIKSQLGGASTLLNAGKTTNFIYKISNPKLSSDQIEKINLIDTRSKIKDRLEAINENSEGIEFIGTENPIFENNLTLIDSQLPFIIANILYIFFNSTISKSTDLVAEITSTNPLNFNTESNHPYYSYKMKRFLTDIALGMMPSKVWTGELDATGGYLIVKENGDIVCYHIYNRNEFEDYLLNNTKLETASSSRHDFGKIYTTGDELRFKLNLQIRFIK
tara:strand:- start:465 stop:1544 length:1080 start_codon:yes stop_codon:yes gene_type:complete